MHGTAWWYFSGWSGVEGRRANIGEFQASRVLIPYRHQVMFLHGALSVTLGTMYGRGNLKIRQLNGAESQGTKAEF